jgi:integrase/recombinase XerD
MHLLRQGTPLKTIADLLGHRSVESTSMYLRLDVNDLRDVALPFPKEGVES